MKKLLLLLAFGVLLCIGQRVEIKLPGNNSPVSPPDKSIFTDSSVTDTVAIGFESVYWPTNRYANGVNNGERSVPVICHGEVIWASEYDSQGTVAKGTIAREHNCWNRDWDSTGAISFKNCLQICAQYNSGPLVQLWTSSLYCGGKTQCYTSDNSDSTFYECRSCGDTKVLPIAYLAPSYGDEDVKTSYLRMTVAGAFSNGMQVLYTLWSDQNVPIAMHTQSGSLSNKVYSAPVSYCSDRISNFQVGFSMNPTTVPSSQDSATSGWLEGERCQLHNIDFTNDLNNQAINFYPSSKYWITIEFRNAYFEIYASDIRESNTGFCKHGLFGKRASLTTVDTNQVIGTPYYIYCESYDDTCSAINGRQTLDTNGNHGSQDRTFGQAWISGISFQFLSRSFPCDNIFQNKLISLSAGDTNVRAEKCSAQNSENVVNWDCDVCQGLLNGATECTDETGTDSTGLHIWKRAGTVSVFAGMQTAGFAPVLQDINERFAYLGMRGVILNPNTVLSMTTVLSTGEFHWFNPKIADFTNPISFDFNDNNYVFYNGANHGQLATANQFCGNCMLNIWRIDNIPSVDKFFDSSFSFNVSVLGGGLLCAADFEIYFPMQDIKAPTIQCQNQAFTFGSGGIQTLGANLVNNFITSTVDNCDWAGDNHAYTKNDAYMVNGSVVTSDSLSILNYPFKTVTPYRTDVTGNGAACNVTAYVDLSPYILFYPTDPVLQHKYATCANYVKAGNSFLKINVNELKFDWYNKIWTRSGTGTAPGVIVSNAVVVFSAVLANDEGSKTPTIFYFNQDQPVPFSPEISSTYGEYRYTGDYSALLNKDWHLKMTVSQTRNGNAETVTFDSSCVTFVDPHAG